MSLKAMIWVMEEAPVDNHAELVVLYALADRASDNGQAAYPSVAWIADRARCSTRTVQRHLKNLEKKGLIRKGDQRIVAHFRSDRRPTVWDLDLSLTRANAGCQPVTPDEGPRGDTGDVTGCQNDANGVTPSAQRGDTALSPKPSLTIHKPSSNQPPVVPQGEPTPKPKRGHRLPDGWMPDPDVIQAMAQENPDVDLKREHDKFTDHWAAASGANARKVDWNAAWRNWIRRAAERTPARRAGGQAPGYGTRPEDWLPRETPPQPAGFAQGHVVIDAETPF